MVPKSANVNAAYEVQENKNIFLLLFLQYKHLQKYECKDLYTREKNVLTQKRTKTFL